VVKYDLYVNHILFFYKLLKPFVNIAVEMSLFEIMNTIQSLYIEIETVSKSIKNKNQENKEIQISVNRLITQIQKHS